MRVRTALTGVVAGALGVMALDAVNAVMVSRQSEADQARTLKARPHGQDPVSLLASRIERALGLVQSEQRRQGLIQILHYGLGIYPAVTYALARRRRPVMRLGRGGLYGLMLFLVRDEALSSASGLAGRPTAYPWTTHLRGLLSHLAYGLTLEAVLRAATPDERGSDADGQAGQPGGRMVQKGRLQRLVEA